MHHHHNGHNSINNVEITSVAGAYWYMTISLFFLVPMLWLFYTGTHIGIATGDIPLIIMCGIPFIFLVAMLILMTIAAIRGGMIIAMKIYRFLATKRENTG